jgi:hypothetical protein
MHTKKLTISSSGCYAKTLRTAEHGRYAIKLEKE